MESVNSPLKELTNTLSPNKDHRKPVKEYSFTLSLEGADIVEDIPPRKGGDISPNNKAIDKSFSEKLSECSFTSTVSQRTSDSSFRSAVSRLRTADDTDTTADFESAGEEDYSGLELSRFPPDCGNSDLWFQSLEYYNGSATPVVNSGRRRSTGDVTLSPGPNTKDYDLNDVTLRPNSDSSSPHSPLNKTDSSAVIEPSDISLFGSSTPIKSPPSTSDVERFDKITPNTPSDVTSNLLPSLNCDTQQSCDKFIKTEVDSVTTNSILLNFGEVENKVISEIKTTATGECNITFKELSESCKIVNENNSLDFSSLVKLEIVEDKDKGVSSEVKYLESVSEVNKATSEVEIPGSKYVAAETSVELFGTNITNTEVDSFESQISTEVNSSCTERKVLKTRVGVEERNISVEDVGELNGEVDVREIELKLSGVNIKAAEVEVTDFKVTTAEEFNLLELSIPENVFGDNLPEVKRIQAAPVEIQFYRDNSPLKQVIQVEPKVSSAGEVLSKTSVYDKQNIHPETDASNINEGLLLDISVPASIIEIDETNIIFNKEGDTLEISASVKTVNEETKVADGKENVLSVIGVPDKVIESQSELGIFKEVTSSELCESEIEIVKEKLESCDTADAEKIINISATEVKEETEIAERKDVVLSVIGIPDKVIESKSELAITKEEVTSSELCESAIEIVKEKRESSDIAAEEKIIKIPATEVKEETEVAERNEVVLSVIGVPVKIADSESELTILKEVTSSEFCVPEIEIIKEKHASNIANKEKNIEIIVPATQVKEKTEVAEKKEVILSVISDSDKIIECELATLKEEITSSETCVPEIVKEKLECFDIAASEKNIEFKFPATEVVEETELVEQKEVVLSDISVADKIIERELATLKGEVSSSELCVPEIEVVKKLVSSDIGGVEKNIEIQIPATKVKEETEFADKKESVVPVFSFPNKVIESENEFVTLNDVTSSEVNVPTVETLNGQIEVFDVGEVTLSKVSVSLTEATSEAELEVIKGEEIKLSEVDIAATDTTLLEAVKEENLLDDEKANVNVDLLCISTCENIDFDKTAANEKLKPESNISEEITCQLLEAFQNLQINTSDICHAASLLGEEERSCTDSQKIESDLVNIVSVISKTGNIDKDLIGENKDNPNCEIEGSKTIVCNKDSVGVVELECTNHLNLLGKTVGGNENSVKSDLISFRALDDVETIVMNISETNLGVMENIVKVKSDIKAKLDCVNVKQQKAAFLEEKTSGLDVSSLTAGDSIPAALSADTGMDSLIGNLQGLGIDDTFNTSVDMNKGSGDGGRVEILEHDGDNLSDVSSTGSPPDLLNNMTEEEMSDLLCTPHRHLRQDAGGDLLTLSFTNLKNYHPSDSTFPDMKPLDLNTTEAGPVTASDDVQAGELNQVISETDLDITALKKRVEESDQKNLSLLNHFDPLSDLPMNTTDNQHNDSLFGNIMVRGEEVVMTPIKDHHAGLLVPVTPLPEPEAEHIPATSVTEVDGGGCRTPKISSERKYAEIVRSPMQEALAKELSKLQDAMMERQRVHEVRLMEMKIKVQEAEKKREMKMERLRELEARQPRHLRTRLDNLSEDNTRLKEENSTLKKRTAELLGVLDGYEKALPRLLNQREGKKKVMVDEVRALLSERNTAQQHVANMETALNDIHQKYERSVKALEEYKLTQEKKITDLREKSSTLEAAKERYLKLLAHATQRLEDINSDRIAMLRSHDTEVARTKAIIQQKELKIRSNNVTIEQKQKELKEMAKIYDELLRKLN